MTFLGDKNIFVATMFVLVLGRKRLRNLEEYVSKAALIEPRLNRVTRVYESFPHPKLLTEEYNCMQHSSTRLVFRLVRRTGSDLPWTWLPCCRWQLRNDPVACLKLHPWPDRKPTNKNPVKDFCWWDLGGVWCRVSVQW
jgi:hypothetical protein